MPEVINTNIMSLTAQNNLNKSQSALATAMQRLSSGLRINSSADDAAGFAISTRMTTQIDGLNTAAQNANDGISLAQTASAALSQITTNLQTIRQLAVQAANATNSSSDRAALDAEVQQRLAEITRVSQQTTFNGRRILDGSFGTAAFQVGANVGETISINLTQGTQASQIGQVATVSDNVSGAFSTGATGITITSSGATALSFTGIGSGSISVASGTYTSVSSLASAINTAAGSNIASVNSQTGELEVSNATSGSITFSGATTLTDLGLTSGAIASGTSAAPTLVDSTNAVHDMTGGISLASGALSINGTSVVGNFANAQALADGINAQGISGVSAYLDANGNLDIQSNGANMSIATASGSAVSGVIASGTTQAGGNLSGVTVTTVAGANDTINRIDAALASVSSIDSQLGAMQNRFDSAVSTAQAVSQNLSASRSRIEDADFAAETAAMSQAQILQQAGVSMLAQANSAPQLVLKLLQ